MFITQIVTRKIKKKTVLDSEGWAQQHVKPARMSMKRMSSLRRSWVFCNELSTKIVSPICATERTAMIVPWHDERTRTGAFVILPADELLSANINRQEAQAVRVAMTTDFDAPLRTQTIITDKAYFVQGLDKVYKHERWYTSSAALPE